MHVVHAKGMPPWVVRGVDRWGRAREGTAAAGPGPGAEATVAHQVECHGSVMGPGVPGEGDYM